MSKNLCILPFISIDRNVDNTDIPIAPCCFYQSNSQHTYNNFEDYWHSDEIVELRSQMLNDQKPKGCWKCYSEESLNKKSMRQSVNDSRLDINKNFLVKKPNHPIQIKMLAGSSCNLACRMCQSHVSSKVHSVWQKIGRSTKLPYQYDTIADEYIRKHADTIQFIDLMGGEPLYHKNILNLLNYLVENNYSKNITLYLTTNGMLIKKQIQDLFKSFKKVVAIFSLDGIDKVHEYIRPGSDWQTIIENMEILRQQSNIDVLVQPTISVLNILRLPDLDKWCEQNSYHQTQQCVVHDPIELNPKQLPLELRPLVSNKYKNFLQNKTYACLGFIKQLDAYWNTDIKNIMPEWDIITKDDIELNFKTYTKIQDFFKHE